MTTHDDIAELIGAYALDAVDADERRLVEDHLAGCARCRAEFEDFREVSALLASGAAAPDGVWDRIAGSLHSAPPPLQLPVHRGRRRPGATALLAAAAAIVVAVLGVQVHRQDNRIDDLRSALAQPMAPAYHDALADPASDVVDLTDTRGHVVARVAITPGGTAYLGLDDLPQLAPDRTYQLWGKTGNALVSLGVLGSHPSIIDVPAGHYTLLAITEEVAAGVVQSRNTPIATATISA